MRIKAIRWSGIGAAAIALALTSACEREPDLDPPAKVQVACTPSATATPVPSAATASAPASPIVLVLDTGDRSARWVNDPGAPVGVLTLEDQQYRLRFGQGPTGWRATLNRFDGVMVREVGKAGSAQTPQRFACKRETEGPKF